jgi:hypothetical protein
MFKQSVLVKGIVSTDFLERHIGSRQHGSVSGNLYNLQ